MSDELRILRARAAAAEARLDVEDDRPGRDVGAPAFLGKVYDGGSIPSAGSKVYLVHPVSIDGDETEGADATPTVDEDRSIPVVFQSPPIAGETYSIVSVGGRWVAATGGGSRGRVAVATAAITARSGATPGSGTVQPKKLSGGSLVDEGDPVEVRNAGPAISSGKYCSYWFDPDGVPWAEPEECE